MGSIFLLKSTRLPSPKAKVSAWLFFPITKDVMGGSWSLEHRPSCASAVVVGAYGPHVALKMVWLALPLP